MIYICIYINTKNYEYICYFTKKCHNIYIAVNYFCKYITLGDASASNSNKIGII